MKGTVVPVTLADGRTAQLFIPAREKQLPHTVYLRDDNGLYPVQINANAVEKSGAAIGATAGGIGGLIYDLATRDKGDKK